jgi:hypothetical protein
MLNAAHRWSLGHTPWCAAIRGAFNKVKLGMGIVDVVLVESDNYRVEIDVL